jgi:hypothetical protein
VSVLIWVRGVFSGVCVCLWCGLVIVLVVKR